MPDFARFRSDWRLASKSASYSRAVRPSMPGAPSLRVRLHASRSHSISMWCDRLFNAVSGICCASFAIRRSFVEIVSELGVSSILPSDDSSIRHPLSSTGSRGDSSPASAVLRGVPTPRHASRCASSVHAAIPLCSAFFAPSAVGATAKGQDLSHPVSVRESSSGHVEGSQVPGEPQCVRALLSDPGGTPAPGHCGAFVLPRFPELTRLPRLRVFRGSITRPTRSLSTLRSAGSPRRHARLASGWWPAFARRGLHPPGSYEWFQVIDTSSTPRLCLAQSLDDTMQVDLHGQQSSGCQPAWLPTFGGLAGTGDPVRALAVFDDGGGPALFVAGDFAVAGGLVVNGIAKWDGATWSTLATGADGGSVSVLAVFDDGGGPALYAGGGFTSMSGVAGTARIAKWDGVSWSPLERGIDDSSVQSLAVFDDGGGPALYVGGSFTSASNVPGTFHIAKWDGAWSGLGGISGAVNALAVFDDGGGPALHAAGFFAFAGAVSVKHLAKWDGSSWFDVGGGTSHAIHALAVFDDGGGPALYLGGEFVSAGGLPSTRSIAKWDGTSFSALGGGVTPVNNRVWALTVFDDGLGGGPALYAGGSFSNLGGVAANHVTKWDGISWSPLGSGLDGFVYALTPFDDGSGQGSVLVAGGWFGKAGGGPAEHVASWDGAGWSNVGGGTNDAVRALTVFDDGLGGGPALHAAGDFTLLGGVQASHVGKWDGASWLPLGSGLQGDVHALAVFDDGGGNGPALYAAGDFFFAGGNLLPFIARWDGTSWSGVGSLNKEVRALAVFDDGSGPALYAGGIFWIADGVTVNGIAKWDGSTWSALGSGVSGCCSTRVEALTAFDDGGGPALFVAGDFAVAGGLVVNDIAKWDGAGWSALGSGLNAKAFDLAVHDEGGGAGPALYVGGRFTSAGGVPVSKIASWNGASWSPLGGGVSGPGAFDAVHALSSFDDGSGAGPALHAGGDFTSAGGNPVSFIAKWDGASWSALGSGMNGSVLGLHAFDDGSGGGPSLAVAGNFTASTAGDSFLARWGCPPPTPVTGFCTAKTALFCGPAQISARGASSVTLSSGFTVEAGPVRGCRAGLLLYTNQPVVPAASFGGPGDGLLCLLGAGLRRAGPIESGGTAPQVCDGMLSIDMNQLRSGTWAATGCNPAAGQNSPAAFLSNMGTTVNAQMWGRDSVATGQVLSDGISWPIGP